MRIDLNVLLPAAADVAEREIEKLLDRVRFAGRNDVVVALRSLKHHPHRFDVVFRVTPVALGVEIAEVKFVLLSSKNFSDRACDLSGDEGFAAARGFVVEEDSVRGMQSVGFAVVHGGPVREDFRAAIGAARVEGRCFLLRNLQNLAVHLGARSLVETGFDPRVENRVQEANGAEAGDVSGVLGRVEAHADMALGAEVVDLGGLYLAKRAIRGGRIREIAVMEKEARVFVVGIPIEVVDPIRIERAGATNDTVNFVTFFEKQLGQIRAILARNSGDQCLFHRLRKDHLRLALSIRMRRFRGRPTRLFSR